MELRFIIVKSQISLYCYSYTGTHWTCVINIQHVVSVRVLVISSVDGALLKTGNRIDIHTYIYTYPPTIQIKDHLALLHISAGFNAV